ncbi:MAG: dihydrolipoyl dehydrogenase [Spirochaetota bacterium]
MSNKYDLIIIGGGPGGYVAGIRAGQLGLDTVLIDKRRIGGMCLNWGCIPSKALLESAKFYNKILEKSSEFGIEGIDKNNINFNWDKAIRRKNKIVKKLVKGVEYLLKKNNVDVVNGEAEISGENEVKLDNDTYTAKNIILATGSRPSTKPFHNLTKTKILEIDEFFGLKELPDSFIVYGGNPTACEMANMLSLAGKEVSIITPDEKLLPSLDSSLSDFMHKNLNKKRNIDIYYKRKLLKDGEDGIFADDDFVKGDVLLNCADRLPVLPETNDIEFELDNGFISINEYMQTSISHIYAIGDITGSIFAQTASAQGLNAVNHIKGVREPIDYNKLPVNIYTEPEIASVGFSEKEIKEKGIEYNEGTFPLTANGKALTEGFTEGFVKILSEKKYGEVIGVHIVAPNATDMINEAVTLMQLEGCVEDVANVIHTHPTISETFREASLVSIEKPIHI